MNQKIANRIKKASREHYNWVMSTSKGKSRTNRKALSNYENDTSSMSRLAEKLIGRSNG